MSWPLESLLATGNEHLLSMQSSVMSQYYGEAISEVLHGTTVQRVLRINR